MYNMKIDNSTTIKREIQVSENTFIIYNKFGVSFDMNRSGKQDKALLCQRLSWTVMTSITA